MSKTSTPKLSKEENVVRGYAVYNPNGIYRNPIPGKWRGYVDSGHMKVDEWGNAYTTDQFDVDIKNLPKPEMKSLSTGDGIDRVLDAIAWDDIQELRSKITLMYPETADFTSYLFDSKPAGLLALEANLAKAEKAYWTAERRAFAKANYNAQNAYETAIVRIQNLRSNLDKDIERAKQYIFNAVERRNNPELAAQQDKCSAIIEDKKRSTEQKSIALLERNKSANASQDAKYAIVMRICSMLGRNESKEAIFASVSRMDDFTALAYKNEEKEFNRIYKNTVDWLHHKNQIKVFWDLIAQVYFGLHNSKIRVKTRNDFVRIITIVALHQAKDNQSRGLVAFRYFSNLDSLLTRTMVVSPKTLEPKRLSEKFSGYAKLGYITYEKGEQGGVASRAGIVHYSGTLTDGQINEAKSAILEAFAGSEIDEVLTNVLALIKGNPAYNDQDLENAVDAVLQVFVPLTRKTADDRIAERHIEETPFREELVAAFEAREKEEAEATARVNEHIKTGLGFQPRMRSFEASESHVDALV